MKFKSIHKLLKCSFIARKMLKKKCLQSKDFLLQITELMKMTDESLDSLKRVLKNYK